MLFLLPFCVFGVVMSLPTVMNSWSVLEMSPDPGGLPLEHERSTFDLITNPELSLVVSGASARRSHLDELAANLELDASRSLAGQPLSGVADDELLAG